MIDFATIKKWEIPEGIVKQVTDASGRVLWCAVKMVKLTLTSQWDGMDGDSARIIVRSAEPFAPDPSNPSNKVTSWTVQVSDQPNRTIEVPVGSTIECTISRDKGNADSYIGLNGINMVTGEGSYTYTLIGDASIAIKELYSQGDYGVINITGEVTHISFTMNGETYQAIEGMSWKAWFASSYNTTGETKGTITDANGNEVSMDSVIVGGTAYEVGFDDGTRQIAFARKSGSSAATNTNKNYGKVVIDGVTYYTGQENAIKVPVGTSVKVTVMDGGSRNLCYISHIKNGSQVYYVDNKYLINYEFNIEGDTTFTFYIGKYNESDKTKEYGQITITET